MTCNSERWKYLKTIKHAYVIGDNMKKSELAALEVIDFIKKTFPPEKHEAIFNVMHGGLLIVEYRDEVSKGDLMKVLGKIKEVAQEVRSDE